MRWSRAGIALSVALHAALAVYFSTRTVERPEPQRTNTSVRTTIAAAASPVEIVLFDLSATETREHTTEAVLPSSAHDVARRSAARATEGAQEPSSVPTEVPARSLLAMRRPGAEVSLKLSNRDEQVSVGRDPARPQIDQQEQGHSSETFTFKVEKDGSVTIRDKPNIQFAKLPTRREISDTLQAWYDRDKFRPDPDELPKGEERPIEHPIGSIGVTIIRFDVSDWLMRANGQDPYASAKLKVLDATRDQRVEVGTKYRRAQLARAGELVQENLTHLWTSVIDPSERKRELFELWDDCAESGDQHVIDAGHAARARVIAFIRVKIPAGSADAFTTAELVRFNERRKSKMAFVPYENR